MNRRSKFFQSAYHIKPITPPTTFNECDVTPIIDQNEVAVLCPVTEHGLVGDVLSRALRATSPEMQNSLLSLLSDNGITPDTKFSSLDDDTRMNLSSGIHRDSTEKHFWIDTKMFIRIHLLTKARKQHANRSRKLRSKRQIKGVTLQICTVCISCKNRIVCHK